MESLESEKVQDSLIRNERETVSIPRMRCIIGQWLKAEPGLREDWRINSIIAARGGTVILWSVKYEKIATTNVALNQGPGKAWSNLRTRLKCASSLLLRAWNYLIGGNKSFHFTVGDKTYNSGIQESRGMGKESRRKELGCQERHFRKDEDWGDLDLLKMSLMPSLTVHPLSGL